MGVNLDKLKGTVDWRLQGVGKIEPRGGLVIYQALSEGRAVVTGLDSGHPSTCSTCDITAVPVHTKTLRIRDEYFVYEIAEVEGSAEYAKPASIIQGGRVHRLIFNQSAPGYKAALKEGILGRFLQQAMAQEFARFAALEHQNRRLENTDPRDLPVLLRDITTEGFRVLDELLRKTR